MGRRGNRFAGLSGTSLQLAWSPTNSATCAWTETSTSGQYDIACSNLRQAGAFSVIAKVNGQAVSPAATVTVTSGTPVSLSQPSVPRYVDADVGEATATFFIADAWGNRATGITGQTPTVTLTGGNPEATVSTIVESNGTYSAPLTKLWRATDTWQVTASLGALTSAPKAFTVLAGKGVLSTVTLSGDTTVPAGGMAEVYISLVDQRGNAALPLFDSINVQASPGCTPASWSGVASQNRLLRQVSSSLVNSCALTISITRNGLDYSGSWTVTFTGADELECGPMDARMCRYGSVISIDENDCEVVTCKAPECPTDLNCAAQCPSGHTFIPDESTGCFACLCF